MNITQELNGYDDIIFENYQIFGSGTSIDYDIAVVVENIPNIEKSHKIVSDFDRKLSKIYNDKPVNSNLITIKDGVVVDCFKGSIDELNNSMLYTYKLHPQKNKNLILTPIKRDKKLKLERASRKILSLLSRTEHRTKVKQALRGNLSEKILTLRDINLSKIFDIGKNNVNWKNYLKLVSFQIAQTLLLYNDIEVYTKDEIIKYYPLLENMLYRKDITNDIVYLENYLTYLENKKIEFCDLWKMI